jgi:hypothetical protein
MTGQDGILRLRIVVVEPPPGVRFQLQRGRHELQSPTRHSKVAMTFEFEVRVGTRAGSRPNFLGPFAQGPPAGRFVYVNSGTLAGQADSDWTRRAKVPLTGITWALIEAARLPGSMLEAEIAGTARDGGPSCATVPLMSGGWRVVDGNESRRRL